MMVIGLEGLPSRPRARCWEYILKGKKDLLRKHRLLQVGLQRHARMDQVSPVPKRLKFPKSFLLPLAGGSMGWLQGAGGAQMAFPIFGSGLNDGKGVVHGRRKKVNSATRHNDW